MSLAFDRKKQLARFHPGLKKKPNEHLLFLFNFYTNQQFSAAKNQKNISFVPEFDSFTFVRLASFKGAVAPWLYPYIKNTGQRCSFIIFSDTLQDSKCFFKYHNNIRGIQPIREHTENDVLKFWQMC